MVYSILQGQAPRRLASQDHGSEPGCVISKRKNSKKTKTLDGRVPAAARAKVRDYGSHVLICAGSDCKKRGAKEVRRAFKDSLRADGINREVRTDTVDCLGLCKHGPNAVVYPSGTWYLGLTEYDIPEIVESHLVNGEPVERLSAERRPVKKRKK
ncbi:MAG TPA: (2Fe-2S) ferredoxin domain-containing protein [Rubrobacteraceae bacterium]|nr:(2Fe-2S) ferredoxin domain-containing protein [Rubrobacteraceae bacterium]